jgi:3'(2'), 5'-bisphosphate nucleotidase
MSDAVQAFVDKLGNVELVSMGSSLKLCLVAEGEAHIYPRLGPTSEWDTAASQCVVEQAGGQVVKEDLQRLAYNTKDELLNPYFIACYGVDKVWSEKL